MLEQGRGDYRTHKDRVLMPLVTRCFSDCSDLEGFRLYCASTLPLVFLYSFRLSFLSMGIWAN